MLSPLARQIAALGLALCVVALSLAYPLRGYLAQQSAERAAVAQQAALQQQIEDLQAQQSALEDPAFIKAEAKRRLQYVSPGDTVYVVKVPATAAPPADVPAGSNGSNSTNGSGGTGGGGSIGSDGSVPPSGSAGSGGSTGSPASGGTTPEAAPWYTGLWDTLAHGASPEK